MNHLDDNSEISHLKQISSQTNCLTEIFVERALKRAKDIDDYKARTGKVMGPLHGLPVSIKDQFAMKGLETIMGELLFIYSFLFVPESTL